VKAKELISTFEKKPDRSIKHSPLDMNSLEWMQDWLSWQRSETVHNTEFTLLLSPIQTSNSIQFHVQVIHIGKLIGLKFRIVSSNSSQCYIHDEGWKQKSL